MMYNPRVKTGKREMPIKNTHSAPAEILIKSITDEIICGAKLIEKIGDDIYRKKINGAGSIGEHFRHNLDFLNAFLNGLRTGKIDYAQRERDVRIETDRLFAVSRFSETISKLQNLTVEMLSKNILIRSEIDAALWLESSALRELEFLHSHTVHHHALIAEKLNSSGIRAENNFGVAPSTLDFWAKAKRAG